MNSTKTVYVTAIIAGLVAIGPLSTDMYLPAFPTLVRVLDAEINQVQFTLSIFLIGFAFAQLIYGPLSDRFGRKPVLMVGMFIFLLSSLFITAVETIESLTILRFFQAVGGSAGPVLGRAMVRDIHGPTESAKQLAYIGTAMALAPAIAPILGGYFTIWWGWQSTFIFLTSYAVLVIILFWKYIPETAPPGSHHVLSVKRLIDNYRQLLRHESWPWYASLCAFVFSGLFSFLSGSSFVIIEFLGFDEKQFGLFFAIIVVAYMAGALGSTRLLKHYKIDTIIGWGAILAAVSGITMAMLAFFEFYHIAAIIIPHSFYMVAVGLVLPQAMSGALAPFPQMAGTSSAFLGFIQMSAAAIVGVLVGHNHDGTSRAMAISIALMGCLTFVSFMKLRQVKN